jgi:uncharacterized protein (DUF427 family)
METNEMEANQAAQPSRDQESVWDYPRPPRLEDSSRHIQVFFNGVVLADTRCAKRVLETSHPPVYYIPPDDVRLEYLRASKRSTFCEWKGAASYYTIAVGDQTAADAAWFYPHPSAPFASIAGYVAFYPSKMEVCLVDGERVQAQAGDFYGGWITHEIVGPFKGAPGTWGW